MNFETSDTLRDRLLMMQKIDIIDDLEFWIEARIFKYALPCAQKPWRIFPGIFVLQRQYLVKSAGYIIIPRPINLWIFSK